MFLSSHMFSRTSSGVMVRPGNGHLLLMSCIEAPQICAKSSEWKLKYPPSMYAMLAMYLPLQDATFMGCYRFHCAGPW